MQSAKPFKFKKTPGCFITGLIVAVLFLVVFYLLLSSGSLGGLIHSIVLRATAGNGEAVHVYGGASDLFTYIRADSVVVSNDDGLRVAIFGAHVKGSAYGYLVKHYVQCVFVDSLAIHAPGPSDSPPDSSLAPIFLGTLSGMVTRADTVNVSYGRVVDADGQLLVDSMSLNAAILDIVNVELDVRKASSYIPLFGSVQASGFLFIDSTRTTLDSFDVISPPGLLHIDGFLNTDSTFAMTFDGLVSTNFLPETPLVEISIEGHGSGSIMEPLVTVMIPHGNVHYEDIEAGIHADSIISTRKQCSFHGVSLSSSGSSVSVSGEFDFLSLTWTGSLTSVLNSVNLSDYMQELPDSDISGSLAASGSGTESYFNNGMVSCDLYASRIDQYSLSSMILNCGINQRQLTGTLQATFDGGTISSEFASSLGLDFVPVAWSGSLDANIDNFGWFTTLADVSGFDFSGLRANVFGSGNMSGFSANGSINLDSFHSDELNAEKVSFSGTFSKNISDMFLDGVVSIDSVAVLDSIQLSASGFYADLQLSGNLSDFETSGLIRLESFTYADITTGKIEFSGDIGMNREELDGGGGISVDSIILAGASYSLSAGFVVEPGSIKLDSLHIGAPGDLSLDLSGDFHYGADSLAFKMDGIALTRDGKLRLISEGDLEFVTDSTGLSLDTLWLDLPSGEITADAWMRDDSISASAVLSGVDIASFTSLLGLSVPISGVLGADFSATGRMGNLETVLNADIQHPTYDEWDQSDSLTIDIHTVADSIVVDGIWTWTDGVRSGLRLALNRIWDTHHNVDISLSDVTWLEVELSGIGDELFYLLPMSLKTSGASVSARVEYHRDSAELSVGMASHFDKLFITNPGIEFPGVSAYLTYPDQQAGDSFNGKLSITSGEGHAVTLQSVILLDIEQNLLFEDETLPLELNGYNFRADFNQWETLVAGVGWLQISGSVYSRSDDLTEKPLIIGKMNIDQATISMGGGGTLESSGGTSSQEELPIDLNIRISGDRGIWFRNSYANVELSAEVDISTLQGQVLIGGDVKAVRGAVYLLGRDFQITQGDVRILQTTPLGVELDIQAIARVRSTVSSAEYNITVTVTGNPDKPDITLTGTGPAGSIDERDIVSLLTAGMTYGELQQFDSSALGNVAGNYLGQWLARSIRDGVGLDALQFTPDFSSDSSSLVVNAGKYVLPDLFVSFSSDVFSTDAGTLKAQYYFNRDFFLEGSTKSTLTGNQEPSLELHYTFRY